MASRRQPGRRSARGADRGAGTGDLFAHALDAAVAKAFASPGAPATESPAAVPGPAPGPGDSGDEPGGGLSTLPARMLNEFVYCPRLFYYEHVEGVFVESADTDRGKAIHKRVDKGSGGLPAAAGADEAGAGAGTDDIHSRSVTMGSERLGVIAKMDLIEGEKNASGEAVRVVPVDYKAGSPREGAETRELWDTDRMQLGVQMLVLRENGYACDEGVIYYRGSKQRVSLPWTPELESWIAGRIAAARRAESGPIPPPLSGSPKCVRCSLAPVCLPDETAYLAMHPEAGSPDAPPVADRAPRRSIAPRDDSRALYLNTQGFRVGCADAVLKIKDKDRTVEEVRVSDVSHVAVFGNIQISTQAQHLLCERGIPITWFSMGGWFYGVTRGHDLKNVLSRIAQFRAAADAGASLALAKRFVRGKIHNARVMLMRNCPGLPEHARLRLGRARDEALAAASVEELLGIEGAAARLYYEYFGGMLAERDDIVFGDEPEPPGGPEFAFDFRGRNRRPPCDPVNAMLSLAYSLLAKECAVAAAAVGLDPYVGFLHRPRHGRPALALDVMEEFRPLVADSAVITAINNRYVTPRDFVSAGKAVNLTPEGRKGFFQCFEQRVNGLITHPVFDYKVSYRRAIELQFRLLARVLEGELSEYPPFMTR